MKIVQYISELIQNNGSITIPDFGSFILKDTSSRIDNNKKTVLPPSKVLTFDENIKDNDGVLIDFIVKAEGLSKESAEDAIKKFVQQLKTLLGSGKTVEFRNIGKLHLNHKKQVVFDYDSKATYVSESFGLAPVKYKTLSKTKESKPMKDIETEPKEKKPKKKFPKAAIWLIIILTPIIAAAVLAFLYPDKTKELYSNSKEYVSGLFKKSEPDKNVKNIAVINDTLKNSKKDSVKKNVTDTAVNKKPVENPSNGRVENNNKKNTNKIKPTTDPTNKFHIIVGCFQSKANAEKFFKTIEGKGYSPRFFEAGSDGLYKVSCNSYSTREEANKELRKVVNDLGAGAWILKK